MEKETSCINSRAILDYVKLHNQGDISELLKRIDPEIDALDDPESFLRDPNNWISCEVINNLFEKAKFILKDDMVAYKAARYATENFHLGYVQRIFLKAFWSTQKVITNIQKVNDKLNRNKQVELVKINRNEAIVRLHWKSHMNPSRDICLYNQGVYTSMSKIWGGELNILEERCCYFKNAAYCEYHIKLHPRNRFYEIFSRFFTSKSVLMDTIREMEVDKKIIEQKYEEVNLLNMRLNHKIKQILAIQETSKAILTVLDLNHLLNVIMRILSNVCSIDRALIMLVNQEEECLEYIYGVGFEGDVPDEIENYKVPLDRVSNIAVRVTNTGKSEYIQDVANSSLRKDNIILTHGNPTSVYVIPLITKSKVIGIFATDAVGPSGVPSETRETLEIFAPQIAIAIENARLYQRLQQQMEELKKSHALLSRAEKFSFLGHLAARLAHEIKNPMTAIGTFVQILPKKYNDDEFREDFYKLVTEEIDRVNNLITELLDLVKTRESFFELGDLHSLLEKMILLVSPHSKSKNIEIVRSYDPVIEQIWMDTEKMKQAVLNLLSNAVDFTPDGGRIAVFTRLDGSQRDTPKHVCIEIHNEGEHIPSDIIDKIFDPYFTTKHKSTLHSGTGLGLFVVHQTIQDHHGRIEVKSKAGKGTTFVLRVPEKQNQST